MAANTNTITVTINGETRELETAVGYFGQLVTTTDVRIRRINRKGEWSKTTARVRLLANPVTGVVGVAGLMASEWQLVAFV